MHLRCLFHGHDDLQHHAPGRLFLRCTVCGRETPGWALDAPGRGSMSLKRPGPIGAFGGPWSSVLAPPRRSAHEEKGPRHEWQRLDIAS